MKGGGALQEKSSGCAGEAGAWPWGGSGYRQEGHLGDWTLPGQAVVSFRWGQAQRKWPGGWEPCLPYSVTSLMTIWKIPHDYTEAWRLPETSSVGLVSWAPNLKEMNIEGKCKVIMTQIQKYIGGKSWLRKFCFPLWEVFNKMNVPFNPRSEKAIKMLLFVVLNRICCSFYLGAWFRNKGKSTS